MNSRILLDCKKLTFGYEKALMPPLDWRVGVGESWIVMGENACGKTTLFRSILGLNKALSGTFQICRSKRYISQIDRSEEMPQRVWDFVARGLFSVNNQWIPGYTFRHRRKIEELIADLGLESVRYKQYAELSEGVKQRVRLAQALVCKSELIVLDEPSSAMDPQQTQKYYAYLSKYIRENEASSLVISHHFRDLMDYFTHALVFDEDAYYISTIDELKRNASLCRKFRLGESCDGE